ncbi:MAG: hypothetical protein AB1752_02335 [Candidatus Zixiibacteriota bacterium]
MDAKRAAEIAMEYLRNLVGIVQAVRLEEVEYVVDDDGVEYWLVTLSYESTPSFARDYKVFRINDRTGKVLSMKIREMR